MSNEPFEVDLAAWPLAPDDYGFADLQTHAQNAGLLTKRQSYYAFRIAATIGLFAVGWLFVCLVGDSWMQMICATYLGFWNVQLGLIVHDVGHRQAFATRIMSLFIGYLCGNLLMGISSGWWIKYHNRHHGHPNHLHKDPSVAGRARLFAVATERRGLGGRTCRGIVRILPAVFFLRYTFLAPVSQLGSVWMTFSRRVRHAAVELVLIVAFIATCTTMLMASMPTSKMIWFLVIQYVVTGLYLGAILAPNHVGMPLWDRDTLDWLPRQVLTTRNIRPGLLTDFLFGGLNYQIEHHLFPAMPRPCLRRARIIVMEHCRSVGLPYHETGILGAYAEVIAYLARSARNTKAAAHI